MTMDKVAGCILAGGLARRMGGGDKGLIEIGGRPILEHVIARLAPQCTKMVLNMNGDGSRFALYDLPIVADPIAGHAGPLAGVLAGLDWARQEMEDCTWVVTVATDTPFFPVDLTAQLLQAVTREQADMACACSNGRHHPVFGLWPVALAEDLRTALIERDIRKVDRWTAMHRLAVADFPTDPFDPFFNANRPDDIKEAERLFRAYGG